MLIINQSKLNFLCDLISKNINIDKVRFDLSQTMDHIFFDVNQKQTYVMRLHKNGNLYKLECNSPKMDVTLTEENRDSEIKNLEKILSDYIKLLNDEADDRFIEFYPDYKNILRDEKIKEIQKI